MWPPRSGWYGVLLHAARPDQLRAGVPQAFFSKADPHRTPNARISAMGPAGVVHIDPPKRSGGCKIASQVGLVTSGAYAFGGGRLPLSV